MSRVPHVNGVPTENAADLTAEALAARNKNEQRDQQPRRAAAYPNSSVHFAFSPLVAGCCFFSPWSCSFFSISLCELKYSPASGPR